MQKSQTKKRQEEKLDSTSSTEKTYKLLSGEPPALELDKSDIKTPYGDQLRLTTGNEKPKGKLLETPVLGTPFQMVETEEGEYFIGMKPYVITKRCPTPQYALAELEANRWNVIINLAYAIAERVYNEERQSEINMINEEIEKATKKES